MRALCLLLLTLVAGGMCCAQKIDRIEYFIDRDPGYGAAISVPLQPSEKVEELAFEVPLHDTLSKGLHRFFVRVRDESGMWSFASNQLFYKEVLGRGENEPAAPNLAKVEYYIDTDPGFGSATNVPLSASKSIKDLTFTIPLTDTLSKGLHRFFVRTQDANGMWSFVSNQLFYKEVLDTGGSESTAPDLVKVEYYIDTDPGFGSATNVPLSASKSIKDLTFTIPLADTLSKGLHRFFVRTQDANGMWSFVSNQLFYKEVLGSGENEPAAPNLAKVEYYIDTDPGFGSATNVPLSASKSIKDLTFTIPLADTLSKGLHRFFVRTQDANGMWSFVSNQLFYKEVLDTGGSEPTAPDLMKVEYYIDTDPGFGSATNVPLSASKSIKDLTFTIPLADTLSKGLHRFFVRTQDANGMWSFVSNQLFYKEVLDSLTEEQIPNISGLEYFIDTDPGTGKGKTVPLTPARELKDLAFDIPMDTLELGDHTLFVRAVDENDKWSIVQISKFRVELPTGVFVTLGNIEKDLCVGSRVNIPFTVNSPFSEGNTFIAELSDANGDFAAPRNIGTLKGTGSGTIVATVPYVAAGAAYRVRISADMPERVSVSNNIPLSIHRVPPVFSIEGDTITCPGEKSYKLVNFDTQQGGYSWSLSGGGDLDAAGSSGKVNWKTAGAYLMTVKYSGFCAFDDSVKVLNIRVIDEPLSDAFRNLLPENNQLDLSMPVSFSWSPIPNAVTYDIYIWADSVGQPEVPTIGGITDINYTISNSSLIRYEQVYKWRVVARRACYVIEGPVQTFRTRRLPDLVVSRVTVPAAATTETEVSINWVVRNQGEGGTNEDGWYDQVYLTDQPTLALATEKFLLGNVENFGALSAGESYQSSEFKFEIPRGIQGSHYIIVTTNSSLGLKETTTSNNTRSSTAMSIELAPPPDLQVTALTVSPLSAFSEGEITINYTVTNKGTGPTNAPSWTDQVFISSSEILDLNSAINLFSQSNSTLIPVNGSYPVSRKVNLPERIDGTYYVHVVADRYNQVFEYNQEGNNTEKSLPLNIIQRPTPNLVVRDVSVSSQVLSTGQNVTVSWTTSNEGALEALPYWTESVYLSADSILSASDRQLVSIFQTDTLFSLAGRRSQRNVQIPSNFGEGTYFFLVLTDSDDRLYENPGEDDNVSTPSPKVTIGSPDLRPLSFTAPGTAISEQQITVQWKVKNDAGAAIYAGVWSDKIYLSANENFESGSDIPLGSSEVREFVGAGGEYLRSSSVKIPANISGNFYLILEADGSKGVFEKKEDNNFLAVPIAVTRAPWPDLEMVSINTPARDTVGTTIHIQYTVRNSGLGGLAGKTWTDGIYLSQTATVDENKLVSLGNIVQSRRLGINESYTQQTSFSLPGNFSAGTYYVVVRANAQNDLNENGSAGNNTRIAPGPTILVSLPETDLAVTSGQVLSASVVAGQPVSLRWTVRNSSAQPTAVPSWTDEIYISDNPELDAGDFLVATAANTSVLQAGASYTRTLVVNVPQEAGGKLFFIVNTDRLNQLNDKNRRNNTLALTVDGSGQEVEIVIPPPADLVPVTFNAPNEGVESQPVNITFKVKNTGTGKTSGAFWNDQVLLSTDGQIGNDILIGSVSRTVELEPGQEYAQSIQAFLPPNRTGNFFLLLVTDSNNNIFERGKEGNNMLSAAIFISPQQPSDLIVKDITVPAGEQYAGDNIRIGWTIENKGANAMSGFVRDAVYISKDDSLDVTDVLFGTLDGNAGLSPQDTTIRTMIRPITNVSVGEYSVIVKTDILNNIREQNDGNNQARSAGKISVGIRPLVIDEVTSSRLAASSPLYYRLTVPSELVGETLSVQLDGDSAANAINRIYALKDSVPGLNKHEFSAAVPFSADQELIIPALRAGVYYFMIIGGFQGEEQQSISLLARTIPFGIKTVDANSGGNTGLATLRITGARFEKNMVFCLKKSGDVIQPYKVQYVNQTLAFATFNLLGRSLGVYDVEAVRPGGTSITMEKAFTVRQGPGNIFAQGSSGNSAGSGFVCTISNVGFEDQLGTDIITPANARLSVVTSFIVSFQNNGSVDIPAPTKYLLSLNENVPIGFSIEELKENKNDLILECRETNGPDGILRPGASGFFKVYTVSNNRSIPSIDLVITE